MSKLDELKALRERASCSANDIGIDFDLLSQEDIDLIVALVNNAEALFECVQIAANLRFEAAGDHVLIACQPADALRAALANLEGGAS